MHYLKQNIINKKNTHKMILTNHFMIENFQNIYPRYMILHKYEHDAI